MELLNIILMNQHLIIGFGEIGKAMKSVLTDKFNVFVIDKDQHAEGRYSVIHICFPYNDSFVQQVNDYAKTYLSDGGLVIIHSTVKIGTTKLCQDAVHSPVRGVHPFLEDGLRTFVKYIGGSRAQEAADVFTSLGIKTKISLRSENTEALKLWDTTYYGWNIIFEKAVFDFCNAHDLDFDLIYSEANTTYNQGYTDLGMPHVSRPVLQHASGAIGGHCVIPNCSLLDHDVCKIILEENSKY